MFLTANIDTRRVAIITIPRDTRVDIPGVGLTKINHANAVGEAKETSEQERWQMPMR